MRFKSVFIVLLFWQPLASAQTDETFRVITVSGAVEHVRLNRPLQLGDRIQLTDPLTFRSKAAYAIVISPKTGRKTIRGVPDTSPRELKVLLESFFKADERSTASRGSKNEYWDELNETLRDTVLLLGDAKITLRAEYVNLNPPAVVMAYYKGRDGKAVDKIVSQGQRVCLDRLCLFGSTDFTAKVMIEYYPQEKGSSDLPGSGELIGYFFPRYVDEIQLEKEVHVITETLQGRPGNEVRMEIKKYIKSLFGNVENSNLDAWLGYKKILLP